MLLSLILPAHNEHNRLPSCLETLLNWKRYQLCEVEIIVVENGSEDDTADIARRYGVKLFTLAERGKGGAVRRGMLEASGDRRMMLDVDLAMPVREITRFSFGDVAIGNREGCSSFRTGETAGRHFRGRVFNMLTQTIVPGIADTQCGFKCFSRRAASEIFSRSKITGLGFDVEILYLARRLGYTISEIDITWNHDPDTRIRPMDSYKMLMDLIRIKTNTINGVYSFPVNNVLPNRKFHG